MDEKLAVTRGEFSKKQQLRCMLCGGPQCGKCGPTAYQKLEHPAIPNLHSAWINDTILAMQRPSDQILIEGGVLDSFVRNKITAVFNLTEPGEHPTCGHGLISSSGFPYSPEKLMSAGIKHFNYNWEDMTVPPMKIMMNIVNIACNELAHGGKIAVHCHAGFGRTGITVACIMIAKDLLQSSQVITFVRNRRPGSIQTKEQEKFVIQFEKAWYQVMHCFPLYELNDDEILNKNSNSLYSKTIEQSIKDQQYLLSREELINGTFKHLHKLVHYTSLVTQRLSMIQYNAASLAITGLAKLVPKNNRDINMFNGNNGAADTSTSVTEQSETSFSRRQDSKNLNLNIATAGLSSKNNAFNPSPANAPAALKKTISFMVASNSLSDCSEESIMNDMKTEINLNNWEKLISIGDVVTSSLQMHGESSRQLTKDSSQKELNASNNNNGTPIRSKDRRQSIENAREAAEIMAAVSAKLYAQQEYSEKSTSSHNTGSNANNNNGENHPISTATSNDEYHPTGSEGIALGNNSNNNGNGGNSSSGNGMHTSSSHNAINTIPEGSGVNGTHSNSDEKDKHNNSVPGSRKNSLGINLFSSGNNFTLTPMNNNNNTNSKDKDSKDHSVSSVFSSRMSSMSNLNSNNSKTPSKSTKNKKGLFARASSFTLTKMRENSLKQNSDAEYERSKKMSANLVAQLLLDWLETRKNALLDEEIVDDLCQLWTAFASENALKTPFEKTQSIRGNIEEMLNTPAKEATPTDNDNNTNNNTTNGFNGIRSGRSTKITKGASSKTLLISNMNINESMKANANNPTVKLLAKIEASFNKHLDRYKLELLNSIVQLYRKFRAAGKLANNNEIPPIDILVGLRLSIACIHARKESVGLIRQRALSLDVVKVFLLKHTNMDRVIINNITFSEENYETIKNNIGAKLIDRLDTVLNTFELLIESNWVYRKSKVDEVYWNNSIDHVQDMNS